MSLVDHEDVQIHLPVDKLNIEEIPDDLDDAVEYGERIIRGYLAAVLEPATIAAWVDPDSTPEQIRLICGLLTASKIYRVRFSEDSLDDPGYAQTLYNEAMKMLNDILMGNIILEGVADVTTSPDDTWFQPNDASTDAPKFTISGRF
jgi:hypothetical protein